MKRMLALGWLESTCWAVDDNTLKIMADIAAGITGNASIEALLSSQPMALEGRVGTKSGHAMQKRGRVAVISVRGVISRYANLFQLICGGTSVQLLAKDYNQALNDPSVSAIMLDIDSPGGEVSGIHEMSEMIFAGRSKKKTVAYIGGQGCSAAYWLASSASEVVIDATASVGSIGVVMTLQRNKKNENIEFVSSQSPKKHLDPASSAGRSECQKHLDVLAGVFIDRVARNMKVNRSTVLKDFGRGGVLMGKAAVKNRMAHKLGSFEGVIKQLGGV
ncbi:S49 family peptidase [Vibrio jasicida]|uniref:S49 family peptidase n=3 Tax=Vibrionaceae TaxID=641 RepID=UPI000CE4CE39|nr:S49 family peptidase [Vibrio jasicida]